MQPLRIRAHFRVERRDDGFYAHCPDIKGIFIFCETEAEIIPAMRESLDAYLEMSVQHGDPIPPAIVVPDEEEPHWPAPARRAKGPVQEPQNMDINLENLVYA